MPHVSSSRTIVFTSILIALAAVAICADWCCGFGLFTARAESRAPDAATTTAPAASNAAAKMRVEQAAAQTGVYFEENRGQQNGRVRYMTRGGGHTVFLTSTEAVYVLMHPVTAAAAEADRRQETGDRRGDRRQEHGGGPRMATALYMTLAGARTDANFVPDDQLEHRTNYFRGNDPNGWQTEIPNYRQVTAENIYDGVDIAWRGKPDGAMQYDLIVAPNADPSRIEWRIEGANSVSIDADGNLVIDTDAGQLIQQKPFTYQGDGDARTEIGSGFVIRQTPHSALRTPNFFSVGFEIGAYDRSQPLVIDPSVNLSNLAFSTFLGGSSFDSGYAITIDNAGNVYVTGLTESSSFPTTPGPYDPTLNGFRNVFVTKLNASGSALIYSTYLGGSSNDSYDWGFALRSIHREMHF